MTDLLIPEEPKVLTIDEILRRRAAQPKNDVPVTSPVENTSRQVLIPYEARLSYADWNMHNFQMAKMARMGDIYKHIKRMNGQADPAIKKEIKKDFMRLVHQVLWASNQVWYNAKGLDTVTGCGGKVTAKYHVPRSVEQSLLDFLGPGYEIMAGLLSTHDGSTTIEKTFCGALDVESGNLLIRTSNIDMSVDKTCGVNIAYRSENAQNIAPAIGKYVIDLSGDIHKQKGTCYGVHEVRND